MKSFSLTQQSNNLGWFVSNKYLYILTDKKDLPIVIVESVFEDPEEVANLPVCQNTESGNACIDYTESNRFAIDAELVFPMYQMTLEFMGIGMNAPEDKLLNSSEPQTSNVIQ